MTTTIIRTDTRLSLRLSLQQIILLGEEIAKMEKYLIENDCDNTISLYELTIIIPDLEKKLLAAQLRASRQNGITKITLPYAYWHMIHWNISDYGNILLRMILGAVDKLLKSSPLSSQFPTRKS